MVSTYSTRVCIFCLAARGVSDILCSWTFQVLDARRFKVILRTAALIYSITYGRVKKDFFTVIGEMLMNGSCETGLSFTYPKKIYTSAADRHKLYWSFLYRNLIKIALIAVRRRFRMRPAFEASASQKIDLSHGQRPVRGLSASKAQAEIKNFALIRVSIQCKQEVVPFGWQS